MRVELDSCNLVYFALSGTEIAALAAGHVPEDADADSPLSDEPVKDWIFIDPDYTD